MLIRRCCVCKRLMGLKWGGFDPSNWGFTDGYCPSCFYINQEIYKLRKEIGKLGDHLKNEKHIRN